MERHPDTLVSLGGGRILLESGTIEVMEKIITSLEDLEEEANEFVNSLAPSRGTATLVTLSGELGAGKTAFAKAVAHVLKVDGVVTSPTFVLEKIYKLENSPFKRLIHIDAYRLESGEGLASLGFDECMGDSGNLILLEWPEKVAEALPKPAMRIALIPRKDGSRTMLYG